MSSSDTGEDYDQINDYLDQFISEIYIIHTSGIVKFAKSFGPDPQFETQLIGSFITAIESFMEVTSKKVHHDIRLTDIGTSGSRWFVKKGSNVLLVAIVPNDSKFFNHPNGFELIGELATEVMTNFLHLHHGTTEDQILDPEFEEEISMTLVEKIMNYELY